MMKMTVMMVMVIRVMADDKTEFPEGEVTSQATLVAGGRAWVRTQSPDSETKLFQPYNDASPDRNSPAERARPRPLRKR